MHILVTGGAGFIGSNLVDSLIRAKNEVFVIDNLSSGKKRYVNPKAHFYQMDFCKSAKVLNKHKITARTMKQVRKIKKWGLSGKTNGMYGRTGKQNPNWNGGHSPERQCEYAKTAWKELAKKILARDGYKCQVCNEGHNRKTKGLVVHHIKAWSRYPELRFEPTNLQTLCVKCHKKKHSRKKSIR